MRRLDPQAIASLRRKHINGLFAVAVALTGHAKRLATRHTDNGTRRNSITQTKRDTDVLWGIPHRSAPHAVYLELGFRPHWVPERHVGLWKRRHGVPREPAGLFVGGPGSSLQYGGSGATGAFFAGRGIRRERTYTTRGGRSEHLPRGKVGHPILRPTVERHAHTQHRAFVEGWRRG